MQTYRVAERLLPVSGGIRYHRRMTITAATPSALSRGAALFRGLADRNRLAIVAELAERERRVVDLTRTLGLAQGTVSGHLACLRDCGLVVARPEGRQMFYAIAHPELIDLLRSAELLLALTGDAVELCPTYGRAPDSEAPDPAVPTLIEKDDAR